MSILNEIGQKAKAASYELAALSSSQKNDILKEMSLSLIENADKIFIANKTDLKNAQESGISLSLQDRLMLDEKRIKGISDAVLEVVALNDPVGEVLYMKTSANGLQIGKQRVPLGVIAIIYEARPNVTADAAVLCLKSGNAVILRGGKEAINTNIAITNILREALQSKGYNPDFIQIIKDTDRSTANELMKLNEYVDVLIPRGGPALIKATVNNSTVPVIETGTGVCHVYIDEYADLQMGADIIFNAKTSRPSVCNAAESLLVHKSVADKFLPLAKIQLDTKAVELRGCDNTRNIIPSVKEATEEDYYTEFGDFILSVKVVNDIDEAITHINKYGTGHSDAIVTKDYDNSRKFLSRVNSAAVYVNASTRYTDGNEFGMGAEIGISTQKLHARGPMGLTELTSVKFIIMGNGQVRN